MNQIKEIKEKFEENLNEMLTGHCIGVESIVEEKGLVWRLRPSYLKFVKKILWDWLESSLLSYRKEVTKMYEKRLRSIKDLNDEYDLSIRKEVIEEIIRWVKVNPLFAKDGDYNNINKFELIDQLEDFLSKDTRKKKDSYCAKHGYFNLKEGCKKCGKKKE